MTRDFPSRNFLNFYFQSILSPPATNIQPLPEYKTEAAKKPRWVIAHYGAFKTFWDVLVLLATIYVAIVVPYNACFPESEDSWAAECLFPTGTNSTNDSWNQAWNTVEAAAYSVANTSSNTVASWNTDLYQMKRSIVVDVIVEAIFILGKFHLQIIVLKASRRDVRLYFVRNTWRTSFSFISRFAGE